MATESFETNQKYLNERKKDDYDKKLFYFYL